MDELDYTETPTRFRTWGPYDTATGLQWDLCGIIVGTLFSCIMLRDTRDQLVPH